MLQSVWTNLMNLILTVTFKCMLIYNQQVMNLNLLSEFCSCVGTHGSRFHHGQGTHGRWWGSTLRLCASTRAYWGESCWVLDIYPHGDDTKCLKHTALLKCVSREKLRLWLNSWRGIRYMPVKSPGTLFFEETRQVEPFVCAVFVFHLSSQLWLCCLWPMPDWNNFTTLKSQTQQWCQYYFSKYLMIFNTYLSG